ncbi:hypothetical protein TNCV_164331 [Trichonephila clavipes]|nr:hypothetical protein TNCV_164331 [Trichonephila clavipes]
MSWWCPDGTQHLSCWPISAVSGQSLASNGLIVNSKHPNLVFNHMEATHNKLFFSSPSKSTVEPSWFGNRLSCFHHALNTIVFTQCCHMSPVFHLQSPST